MHASHPILSACDPLKGKFLQQRPTVRVRLDVDRLESSLVVLCGKQRKRPLLKFKIGRYATNGLGGSGLTRGNRCRVLF